MKTKTILTTVLFVFIGLSLIYLYIDSKRDRVNSDSESVSAAVDKSQVINAVVDSQSAAVAVNDNKEAEKSAPDIPAKKTEDTKDKNADYVYYFMTAARCPSCMKIEAFTKEAVNENFGSELKKGTLIWKMIPVDQKGNEHFVKDYELYTKSVVLVKMKDGKQVSWKNLDKVWELLGDKETFKKYITGEVTSFIGKG